jgi:hypothetical protein
MTWLAYAVASAPHRGHVTAHGIWPLTGSASNAYFVPQ